MTAVTHTMGPHKVPARRPVPQRVVDRIMDRVDQRAPDECWPWKLALGTHGYGSVTWSENNKNGSTTAHRVVWQHFHGPIPPGMTVDHRCYNRSCCNPHHLRLLTNVENASDNGYARRTHCPQGHPYDDENTEINSTNGSRMCRTCRRERTNRYGRERRRRAREARS